MLEDLTPRQIVIMELLAMGCSNNEIATTLSISEYTVKVHLYRLFGRLGVNRRLDAVELWKAAQSAVEQPKIDALRTANATMLSALEWLASNIDAEPIAIKGVLTNAIAAGRQAASR